MRTTRVFYVIIGAALVGAGWFYLAQSAVPEPLPLAAEDTITSWEFSGSHNDDGPLEEKVRADIKRLKDLLGSGTFTDYALFVSIAQKYEALGDGRKTYEYLSRALEVDAELTGLAWHNLAVLLSRLGAPHTARIAYEKAASVQPYPSYQSAYLNFLVTEFPDDTENIEAAFVTATEATGSFPHILRIRALWLADTGRTKEAIAEWKKILPQVSPGEQTNIREEIQRLEGEV